MSDRAVTIDRVRSRRRPMLFGMRKLLALSPAEANFAVRGFAGEDSFKRQVLETIGQTFIAGYNAALDAEAPDNLPRWIEAIPDDLRGFAVEGAAMATAMTDALPFRSARLPRMLTLFGREFTYLAHVGAGWALAQVPWHRRRILAALDPIHFWLAYDGLGFRDCYFNHVKVLKGWRRISSGYAGRVYDQGVGRALWFVSGGSPACAAASIRSLIADRAEDLFSGLGLAMAYAGPAGRDDFAESLKLARHEACALGQGIAFACEARARARHIPADTKLAANAIGFDAAALAQLARETRDSLPEFEQDTPRYELWRQRIAAAVAHAMGERV